MAKKKHSKKRLNSLEAEMAKTKTRAQNYTEFLVYKYKNVEGNVIQRFHLTLDKEIDKVNETELIISCSKGCGFCCHQEVLISEDEAENIFQYITENSIFVDNINLINQRDNWNSLSYAERACEFLDEITQECKIYTARPSSCRKYLTTSLVSKCENEESIDLVTNETADIIHNVILSSTSNALLPEMILNKL